jgi:hypothetical protein
MRICINIFGQPRNPENLREMLNTMLKNDQHEYHCLYTTWNTENIETITRLNPELNVFLIDIPNKEIFSKFSNLILDPTQRQGKTLHSHLLGTYCKDQTRHSIESYETNNNFTFDIIVTTRPDSLIKRTPVYKFYDAVDLNSSIMYTASDPCWDCYDNGSFPDNLMFSNRNTTIKALDMISIYEKCIVKNTNMIHPETASLYVLKQHHISIKYLDIFAFVCWWPIILY